ncbi:NAD(P)/FAD-dependent oxidoreductase [Robbsia sp. KACC 23696]|uniref:NAD(P)/FAD-dependent oxidoreductase n=1 Tax=Robbsia sp. KACC 23696 TaxID=3149231 RepID=UPI00325AF75D
MSYRIVVVGGGAGGLELATRLGRTLGKSGNAEIILVDAAPSHLWKPLLHEVAAGVLSVAENEVSYIAQASWNHFEFQIGRLSGIDRASKQIQLQPVADASGLEIVPARKIRYDKLVIAVGSNTNDFNTAGAAEHCLFLDSTAQAARFHTLLLAEYIKAHSSDNAQNELRIGIVGAGATGVELAAELKNASLGLAAYGIKGIRPDKLFISIIEAGPKVLPALPDRVSRPVHQTLENIGVEVLTGSPVKEVVENGFHTADGRFIPATLKVWAAGIKAPAFLTTMDGLETNRINQLVVRPTLQTTLDDDIFALGDCAACPLDPSEETPKKFVPPRAQAAHQQAEFLAKALQGLRKGKAIPHYKYVDYGSLVSLSRFSAVGNLMGNLMGSIKVEGWLARMFYISLYRMHQVSIYGYFRTGLLLLSGRISRSAKPSLKLH